MGQIAYEDQDKGTALSLKLYDFPASICAQKVRLVLAEKGLDYQSYVVNLVADEQLGDTYLRINPNGVVPSLDHDGAIINDASAIIEYIDDVFPEPSLSPSDKVARAHMRTWMRFFEEVTTPAVRWPSWQRVFIPMLGAAVGADIFKKLAARQPHHGHFYKRIGAHGFPTDLVAEAEADLRRTFARMDKGFSDGRAFLVGTDPTLADFVVLPLIVRAQDVGLETLWADLPFVSAWFERMRGRPSFGAVFESEGVRLQHAA